MDPGLNRPRGLPPPWRRVALKVIKLGMDTKQVVARFEAERQALAMMDHPNIGKVLDAGMTGSSADFPVGDRAATGAVGNAGWKTGVTGRPYFVTAAPRRKVWAAEVARAGRSA